MDCLISVLLSGTSFFNILPGAWLVHDTVQNCSSGSFVPGTSVQSAAAVVHKLDQGAYFQFPEQEQFSSILLYYL